MDGIIKASMAVVVGVVMLPVVTSVISSGNFTGTTGTVTAIIPTIMALGIMVGAIGFIAWKRTQM